MKKILIVPVLWLSLLLIGCGKQNDVEVNTPNSDVVTPDTMCIEKWWTLINRAEWWDITVCKFDDDSFCFLENLESGNCEQGYIFFEDEEIGEEVNKASVEECEKMDQEIVCGEDWNTYFNRCYMEAAGVEEETELARVENSECIFG